MFRTDNFSTGIEKSKCCYDETFNFFITNCLISTNQSGWRLLHQSILIHGIYASFDEGYEVRGVFLDISKAFDKVWHEGLIFKLKQDGISDKLSRLTKDFLSDWKQRAVLNGQCSFWMDTQARLPQGSKIGPLIFNYINVVR